MPRQTPPVGYLTDDEIAAQEKAAREDEARRLWRAIQNLQERMKRVEERTVSEFERELRGKDPEEVLQVALDLKQEIDAMKGTDAG